MKTRWRAAADDWSKTGNKINSSENLKKIGKILEEEGPIIVERWFYRGASAPERRIFDDYEEFENYMNSDFFAGDSVYVWSYGEVCRDENMMA